MCLIIFKKSGEEVLRIKVKSVFVFDMKIHADNKELPYNLELYDFVVRDFIQ